MATAFWIFALIGCLAISVDVGRAYIVKSESQTFVDSSALSALLELDGTQAGINRARDRIAANVNQWEFGTKPFNSVDIAFGQTPTGPWEGAPANPVDYRFVRVMSTVDLPMIFLPVFSQAPAAAGNAPPALLLLGSTMRIVASSAGGQDLKTSFRNGLLPFSPYAHNPTAEPHYGLAVGQKYTLRWAASPSLAAGNICPGDRTAAMLALATAGGGSERGFIEETSAANIRNSIVYSYQTVNRQIGDAVQMTGGAKQTIGDALKERVLQDTDPTSATFATYTSRNTGNGRRVVGVPINTGYPNYTVVQIGAFFLLPTSEYPNGGNSPFCAEYIGSWVSGSKYNGAAPSGAYYTRLVQ